MPLPPKLGVAQLVGAITPATLLQFELNALTVPFEVAIAKTWGRRAVVSLAFAITASRLFPTLKYALGHGHACRKLDVEGETIVPRRVKEAPVLRGIA